MRFAASVSLAVVILGCCAFLYADDSVADKSSSIAVDAEVDASEETTLVEEAVDAEELAETSLTLSVLIKNIQQQGDIRLALFDQSDAFPKQIKAVRKSKGKVRDATARVQIEDVLPGQYAIAFFQDVNGDGTLNRSKLGIPSEPYGFSNNARGLFGPPSFKAASFDFSADSATLELRLP